MTARRIFKLLGVLLLSAVILALVAPGALYTTSLALLPQYPSTPVAMAITPKERHAWVSAGGDSIYQSRDVPPMAMEQLDPWSVTWHFLFRCKSNTGSSADLHYCVYYFPGYMPAAEAADRHFRSLGFPGHPTFWQGISQTALAIWITRHWSPQQVAFYLSGTETLR